MFTAVCMMLGVPSLTLRLLTRRVATLDDSIAAVKACDNDVVSMGQGVMLMS